MNTKKLENTHIAFWLVKDYSWCASHHWLGLLMIIPTLFLSVKIAYSSRQDFADLVHNTAICFWIAANCTWMTGEFFFHDSTRPYAQVFFFVGLGIIGTYYLYEAGKWLIGKIK